MEQVNFLGTEVPLRRLIRKCQRIFFDILFWSTTTTITTTTKQPLPLPQKHQLLQLQARNHWLHLFMRPSVGWGLDPHDLNLSQHQPVTAALQPNDVKATMVKLEYRWSSHSQNGHVSRMKC